MLDTNVIVGWLDPHDSQHERARHLLNWLKHGSRDLVLLDFIVEETVSVLCRRARERKAEPPELAKAIAIVRRWAKDDAIDFVSAEIAGALPEILDIVSLSEGALNVNDAKLVYLQRARLIGDVASFDSRLAATEGFLCIDAPAPDSTGGQNPSA